MFVFNPIVINLTLSTISILSFGIGIIQLLTAASEDFIRDEVITRLDKISYSLGGIRLILQEIRDLLRKER